MSLIKTNNRTLDGNQGRRNLLYNGAMIVWQRGTSADSLSTGGYMCDRWRGVHSGLDGNYDWDQVTTNLPEGFSYALKVSTDAAESSLDSGDNIKIQQKLEGQDLQHLLKGTTNAKKTTISFWVKSSVASTYTFELVDNNNTRHLSKSYAISAADTWEHKTLVFDGDTTGTLNNGTSTAMTLNWYIDSGSALTSGTFNDTAWKSTDDTERVYDTTGWLEDTSSREFYLAGVQWEIGDRPSDFEYRTYGEELLACQRYFYSPDHRIRTYSYTPSAGSYNPDLRASVSFPVQMRAAPTITTYSDSAKTTTGQTNHGTSGNGVADIKRDGFVVDNDITSGNIGGVSFYYDAASEL